MRSDQVQVSGNFHRELPPDALTDLDAGELGGVLAVSAKGIRFTKAVERPVHPGDPVWEFGINLAMATPGWNTEGVEGQQIAEIEDTYIRGGMGVRGPLHHAGRVSVGAVVEWDLAALPYAVSVLRNTEVEYTDDGFLSDSVTVTSKFENASHETGRLLHLTMRTGLYGAYYLGNLVLTGGIAVQNTPAIDRIAEQEYSCTYEEDLFSDLPKDAARECREQNGAPFPILGISLAARAYGGLHVSLGPMVVSLRIQSAQGLFGVKNYPRTVSGDVELSWRH